MKKLLFLSTLLLIFTSSCTKIDPTAQANAKIIKEYMREWNTNYITATYKAADEKFVTLKKGEIVSNKFVRFTYDDKSGYIIFNLSDVKRINVYLGAPTQIALSFY